MPAPDSPDSFDSMDRVELTMAVEEMRAGRGDLPSGAADARPN